MKLDAAQGVIRHLDRQPSRGPSLIRCGSPRTVPPAWIIAATGDFNGDGKSDILWRDNSTGTVSIWFTNGVQVLSFGSLGAVGANWTIQGLNAD